MTYLRAISICAMIQPERRTIHLKVPNLVPSSDDICQRMEFYAVNSSYIDPDTYEERYVSVPEQGGGMLIPEGLCNPDQVYTVGRGKQRIKRRSDSFLRDADECTWDSLYNFSDG